MFRIIQSIPSPKMEPLKRWLAVTTPKSYTPHLYRPKYLDLCRLFTTEDLRRWYRHIALAEVELRREFDRMKAAGLTPRRYGFGSMNWRGIMLSVLREEYGDF
jgi:hypothetical protein